jgi:hypothetical protein
MRWRGWLGSCLAALALTACAPVATVTRLPVPARPETVATPARPVAPSWRAVRTGDGDLVAAAPADVAAVLGYVLALEEALRRTQLRWERHVERLEQILRAAGGGE